MASYKRMLLVNPDAVESEKKPIVNKEPVAGASEEFYERELVKEKLSPSSAIIEVLAHLQKEMGRVLDDDYMDTREKLSTYNQLMSRSTVLMDKAKSMFHEPPSPPPPAPPPPSPLDLPRPQYDTDTKTKRLKSSRMEDAITSRVPKSYQPNVRKLYKLLKSSDRGVDAGVKWTKDGKMILGNTTVDEKEMTDLLTSAVKPHGPRSVKYSRTPVGRDFARAVKHLNPRMRYIRNKSMSAYDSEGEDSGVIGHAPIAPEQEGQGSPRKKSGKRYPKKLLKWYTRL